MILFFADFAAISICAPSVLSEMHVKLCARQLVVDDVSRDVAASENGSCDL
jgi:hypothetical protein